jgi:hypothetical protein
MHAPRWVGSETLEGKEGTTDSQAIIAPFPAALLDNSGNAESALHAPVCGPHQGFALADWL